MYVISYTGILQWGYILDTTKYGKVKMLINSHFEGRKYAKKYRFKFYAKFMCWMLNKSDDCFRTFTVVKL